MGQVRAEILSHTTTDIIVIVLVVFVFIVLSRAATKRAQADEYDATFDATMARVMAWVIMFVAGGGALLDISTVVVPMIINPEYYAIKIIMNLVK